MWFCMKRRDMVRGCMVQAERAETAPAMLQPNSAVSNNNNNNNVHLSCAHQRPERSHDTY